MSVRWRPSSACGQSCWDLCGFCGADGMSNICQANMPVDIADLGETMITRRTGRFVSAGAVVVVLSCVGVFAAAPANAATAFGDGSFETPVVAPHTFVTIPAGQGLGSWTVASGNVDLIG